ncbi:MAG: GlsB/YeaQ/YmgE family stress response membrane protein [Erythrobacter sp.]|uniref:GlsB/YeaQ/YmgE family stress response membrane protein n=1 Tax=Erythrobacter sp. TaxID=1042 RepID=UPI003C780C72
MGWIIAIIVGGLIGWIASIIMGRDASMGIFWNIIVGLIGALIGGFIGTTLLGTGSTLTSFSIPGLLMSLLGAVVLLAIANLIQRGRVR